MYKHMLLKIKFLILLIILLSLITGCGTFDLNSWVCPDDLEFIAVVEELDTPRKIGDYMLKNFTYEIHDFYTLSPYELWKIKKGDCNDMSCCGSFAANWHDYETYQIKIYDNTLFKHYIAVYVEDNYSITDNQYYFPNFNSFREMVEFVSTKRNKNWRKYIVYDYNNNIVEKVYK